MSATNRLGLKQEFVERALKLQKEYGTDRIGTLADQHVRDLFPKGTTHRVTTTYGGQEIDVQPGIGSLAPGQLNNLNWLGTNLTKELPAQVDELGRVFGDGVRADFHGLWHLTGFPQERATFPIFDNSKLREEKGLSNTWKNKFDERLFRSIVRAFFKDLPDVKVKIKDRTSTSFPWFTSDVVEKKRKFAEMMGHVPQISKLFLAGDLVTAYKNYGVAGPSITIFRDQPTDKVSVKEGRREAKLRSVADMEYAVSGGIKGQMIASSKQPSVWGQRFEQLDDKFFCMRRRVAYAQSSGYSFLLLPVAQSARVAAYDTYGFTLHHTTAEQKRAKFADWEMNIAADVADHDLLWPIKLYIPALMDELKKLGYEAWWIEMFRCSLQTAIYVPGVAVGEGGILIGDWRAPNNFSGLVSGNPFTDILGSCGMIFCYALIQLTHTQPDVLDALTQSDDKFLDEWRDRYMQGKEDIGAPSKSDDAFLLFRGDRSIVESSKTLMSMMKEEKQVSPYMLITLEHGGAMLGDIYLYDDTKRMSSARFIGNATSLPGKMWEPEYACKLTESIKGMYEPNRLNMRARAYPGMAVPSRIEKYGSMPSYEKLTDLLEYSFNKFLAPTIGLKFHPYFDKMAEDHKKWMQNDLMERIKIMRERGLMVDGGNTNYTLAEMEYVNEPDLVSWKFKTSEIREELLALNFGELDENLTLNFLDSVAPNVRAESKILAAAKLSAANK